MNLARRIQSFDFQCSICGDSADTDIHILLHCPLAFQVWMGSDFPQELWESNFPSVAECIIKAGNSLDHARLGEFVAVLWEVWNARNCFLFGKPDRFLGRLACRAIGFVKSFREVHEAEIVEGVVHPSHWKPPQGGLIKINFDGGMIGSHGRGWGFVMRNHEGDVLAAGASQGIDFVNPQTEEARACLFALKFAQS